PLSSSPMSGPGDVARAGPDPFGVASGTPTLFAALVRTMRPKQWVKNLLVIAAPAAAGVIDDQLLEIAAAFVAFCLAASATYLFNDALDAQADREHPTKRH